MASTTLTRTASWQGRQIAWDVLGEGPPVVLLHGTPWSSWLWREQATVLARDHTVYLWDMPGYGASSMLPEHAVDLGTQGEAFAHLVDHWGLEAPHVIAHDVGGAVALRAHLLHGVRMSSLCLVDVVALAPWGSPFFRLVGEHADVFTQLPLAVHEGAVRGYVAGASHRGLTADALDAIVAPWADEAGQRAFVAQIAQADERLTDEVEPLLRAIDVPTHIVWGDRDAWIPVDRAHRLHEAIPGSTLTVVHDAGHLIQLDAPAALAADLGAWMRAVRR